MPVTSRRLGRDSRLMNGWPNARVWPRLGPALMGQHVEGRLTCRPLVLPLPTCARGCRSAGHVIRAGHFDDRPELELGIARPGFDNGDRLIEVRDLEDAIATEGLPGKGAVRDFGLSAMDFHRCGGLGGLKLMPLDDRALLG